MYEASCTLCWHGCQLAHLAPSSHPWNIVGGSRSHSVCRTACTELCCTATPVLPCLHVDVSSRAEHLLQGSAAGNHECDTDVVGAMHLLCCTSWCMIGTVSVGCLGMLHWCTRGVHCSHPSAHCIHVVIGSCVLVPVLLAFRASLIAGCVRGCLLKQANAFAAVQTLLGLTSLGRLG